MISRWVTVIDNTTIAFTGMQRRLFDGALPQLYALNPIPLDLLMCLLSSTGVPRHSAL
jgi:hypothetical protein